MPRLYKRTKNIIIFTLIISYVFIILLAYVFNTIPGILTAHGVQGRYFIPFLPFMILLLIQFKPKLKNKKKKKTDNKILF